LSDSELHWSSLTVLLWKQRSGEELLQSSKTTFDQFASRKVLFLREIQGWMAPGQKFKKVHCENKNVIRKYFELQIYSTKPSVGLPKLVRHSL
jgi:hypothetical protein